MLCLNLVTRQAERISTEISTCTDAQPHVICIPQPNPCHLHPYMMLNRIRTCMMPLQDAPELGLCYLPPAGLILHRRHIRLVNSRICAIRRRRLKLKSPSLTQAPPPKTMNTDLPDGSRQHPPVADLTLRRYTSMSVCRSAGQSDVSPPPPYPATDAATQLRSFSMVELR